MTVDRPATATGGEVVVDALTLPPAAASVGEARNFVEARLADAGLIAETVDTAVLLVSELVTNSVLHASTELEVRVHVGGGIRVDVRDESATAPVRQHHNRESVTGRGLELIETLAADYGVKPTSGGKTVWFTVGRPQPEGPRAGVSGWRDGEREEPVRTAELRGLPRVLYEVMYEHHEALVRDYALYCLDHGGEPVPAARDISAAARVHAAIDEEVRAHCPPVAEPTQRVDVPLRLTDRDVAALDALRTVLEDAERLASDGLLLTRPALPELSALRDWCLDELRDQVAGAEPRRWQPPVEASDESVRRLPLPEAFAWIRTETRPVVLGDANNRIVAVSPPAATLLGWAADELAGRRIVTIIPERLRDAHVAGFTRQLITGRVHILDQASRLPARHADGHEIPAMVTLQRVHDRDTVFFLAWIVPDPD